MGEKKWYVLRTVGGKEKKVKEYLEKEIERTHLTELAPQVLVPTEKSYKVKNGKRVVVEKICYPGYVLLNADMNSAIANIVTSHIIPGLAGFLTEKSAQDNTNKIPVPIRDEEARRILGEQDENAAKDGETEMDFQVGDAVNIIDGPFNGFSGQVEGIDEDRSKLKVIVMIFGRKTMIELDFTQVTQVTKD